MQTVSKTLPWFSEPIAAATIPMMLNKQAARPRQQLAMPKGVLRIHG